MHAAKVARQLLAPGGMSGAKVRQGHLARRLEIALVQPSLCLAQRRPLGLLRLDLREDFTCLRALEAQDPSSRLVHIRVAPQPRRVANLRALTQRPAVHVVPGDLHHPHERHPLLLVVALRLRFVGPIEPERHDRDGVRRKLEDQPLHAVDEVQALERLGPARALVRLVEDVRPLTWQRDPRLLDPRPAYPGRLLDVAGGCRRREPLALRSTPQPLHGPDHLREQPAARLETLAERLRIHALVQRPGHVGREGDRHPIEVVRLDGHTHLGPHLG